MTNEEAIIWLNTDDYESKGYNDAIAKSIKALEQQPCEDCISRQAVLDGIDRYIEKTQSTSVVDDFISFKELIIKQLPSVTPQRSKGKWLDDCGGVKCSCCGYYIDDYYYCKNYCTNCGAELEEA